MKKKVEKFDFAKVVESKDVLISKLQGKPQVLKFSGTLHCIGSAFLMYMSKLQQIYNAAKQVLGESAIRVKI